MRVIITDAQANHALPAVRSLGKRGIEVTAASYSRHAFSFYSKYCKNTLIYPSPYESIESFIKFMLWHVKSKKYDVIIPMGPADTLAFSLYKEEFLPHVQIPVADFEIFIKAWDKSKTFKIAMKKDIPCPKTFFPQSIEEVLEISKDVEYPVVIKARISGGGSGGVSYANSPQELIEKYKKMHNKSFIPLIEEFSLPMIQEYIPGEGCGFYALFWNSKPKAIFTHKRIREYPITGGPSSLRESTWDPDVINLGIKILKMFKWHGVAMVEFKRDSRDGQLKLIEINPKFWGSLHLSISSGVDFPYLLYRLAIGENVEPVISYKVGIKARWLFPWDILWFLASLKSSDTNKLKVIRDFFRFFDRDLTYDTLSFDDPKPAIVQIAQSSRVIVGTLTNWLRNKLATLNRYKL